MPSGASGSSAVSLPFTVMTPAPTRGMTGVGKGSPRLYSQLASWQAPIVEIEQLSAPAPKIVFVDRKYAPRKELATSWRPAR